MGKGGPSWTRRRLPHLAECRQRTFQQVHLGEGEEEGEGRFGALVAVDPVLLEAVAAPPGGRVVEALSQVIAAEEPLEGGAGLAHPTGVLGDPVRLQTGTDRRRRLQRLLVEPGPLVPLAVKPVAADPPKVLLWGRLDRDQPAESVEPDLHGSGAPAVTASGDQGLRQSGDVVAED